MGLWDNLRKQFIDVIEWDDPNSSQIVWKFPREDNEIKNGAQLIVRESQSAVFLHEGELGDVFRPGRFELTTSNLPVLTTLASWKYAFNSPFKCDVFFVTTKQLTDLKWGTQNPIMLRDPEFGPVRLRAFGTYCIRISDPGKFIGQVAGTGDSFDRGSITGQLRNMIVSRFADALGELKVPMLDLAANYSEAGETLRSVLQPEFDDFGVELTKFYIENISLPPEVEEALDKRSKMGLLGNMNTYTQYQTANAIENMSKNPGSGPNMMGMFAGLNMGGVMGGVMGGAMNNATQGAQQQQAQGNAAGAPPPVPQESQWHAVIEGKQAGPFPQSHVVQAAKSGQLSPETLLWKQGMGEWAKAATIQEFQSLFNTNPPPPPIPES